MTMSNQQDQRKEQRDTRNRDEKAVVVPERTERRTCVGDIHQMKEVRDHDDRIVRVD